MSDSVRHYSSLEWVVEKQMSVEDNLYIKDLSKQDLFFYIIKNSLHNYRMGLVTTYPLYLNQRIDGMQLNFHKGELGESCSYVFKYDDFGKKYIDITQNKTKKNYTFVPKNIFFQSLYKDGKYIAINKYKVHGKKFCTFKRLWFKQALEKYKIQRPIKKIVKTLLNDAIIDNRIMKIIKTQFFIIDQSDYMYQNTHSIVMTNGGTGKSSLIGIMGQNLDETSNAGIYGYYSTNKDQWNSGIVSQTKSSIIIDELNEIINKQKTSSDNILSTLNKPLENGNYYYGKAGGKQLSFGNQFIFLANVTPQFYFENLLTGMANNLQTIGRRFAYILYDDTMEFKAGGKRINQPNKIIKIMTSYMTYIYKYMTEIKGVDKKIIKRQDMRDISSKYKKELLQKVRGIEYDNTKQVLESYIKSSIDNRLPFMALKIALFDKFELITQHDDLNKFDFSIVLNDVDKIYEELLKDITISVNNIVNHLNNNEVVNTSAKIKENEFKRLTKYQKILLYKLQAEYENYESFIKKYYHDLSNKEELKYYIKDIKKYSSYQKQNITLNKFGVTINMDKSGVYFCISNYNLFKEYSHIILDNMNETIKTKKFAKNNEIDEIDMDNI